VESNIGDERKAVSSTLLLSRASGTIVLDWVVALEIMESEQVVDRIDALVGYSSCSYGYGRHRR